MVREERWGPWLSTLIKRHGNLPLRTWPTMYFPSQSHRQCSITFNHRCSSLPYLGLSVFESSCDFCDHWAQCQWLFLVPLKGGRWRRIPQVAVYITYIPLIYCLLGGYRLPTTFYILLREPERTIDICFFLRRIRKQSKMKENQTTAEDGFLW